VYILQARVCRGCYESAESFFEWKNYSENVKFCSGNVPQHIKDGIRLEFGNLDGEEIARVKRSKLLANAQQSTLPTLYRREDLDS
jgi:hypothetical protein